MSIHQHATLEDTVYFWFGSNDVNGSGNDGATPVYDVRLAGAAAAAAPVLSGAATLLTHASYPPGAHEVAIAATAVNGFAANATYAVFCTLLVDGQNPTGFVGSFTLTPLAKASVCTETRLAELDAGNLPTDIADIPTVAEFEARTLLAAAYFDPAADAVANVTLCATCTTNTDMRGTNGANTVVPDVAGTAAALHVITDALIAALNDPTAAAIAAAVWALAGAIDGKTPAEALKIIAATTAGKASGVGVGAAPWTETFVGLDGATPRVEAVIDATYNRTAVTYL